MSDISIHARTGRHATAERTRRTLIYPSIYLIGGGLGLLLWPDLMLRLLLAARHYDLAFPRFAGAICVGLGLVVLQIMRRRVVVLYPTLIWARVFMCACYAALAIGYHERFFWVIFAMVGVGAVATTICWQTERGAARTSRSQSAGTARHSPPSPARPPMSSTSHSRPGAST
jgi:hypothetical protein